MWQGLDVSQKPASPRQPVAADRAEFVERLELRLREGDKAALQAAFDAENSERRGRWRFRSLAAWARKRLGLDP